MAFVFASGVVLQHTQLVSLNRTNETAGPNNLVRVRLELKVRGYYNPAMASYLFAAAGGSKTFGPVFTPGRSAPATQQAVEWALQQPRRPFAFVAGGFMVAFGPKPITFVQQPKINKRESSDFLLSQPFLGTNLTFSPLDFLSQLLAAKGGSDPTPVVKQKYALTDVNNGPVCTARVIENIGDKTFQVEWQIETWINDAPVAAGAKGIGNFPTSPLLAQEYSMTHTIDQDFFCTRHVEGRAIFRSDVMQALQLFPDQLRYWLGHPIPTGFSRSQIQVRAESNANTLQYRFIDQQRRLNFDPNRFTRAEMTISMDQEMLGLESILRSGIHAGLGAFMPIATRTSPSFGGGFLGSLAGAAIGGVIGTASAFGLGYLIGKLAGVPVTSTVIQGRFWGHPDRYRRNFENDAIAAFDRMAAEYFTALRFLDFNPYSIGYGRVPANFTIRSPFRGAEDNPLLIPIPYFGGKEFQLGDTRTRRRSDVSGVFVEFEKHYIGSRLQTLFPPDPRPAPTPAEAAAIAREQERQRALIPIPPPEPKPILPDPMYGTYLGLAVANALRDSADLWAQVADPPLVNNKPFTRSRSLGSGGSKVTPFSSVGFGSSPTTTPANTVDGFTLP